MKDYEEIREQLGLCQGVQDGIEEEYEIDDEIFLTSLHESIEGLNSAIARLDAIHTGGTTKFQEGDVEKARRAIQSIDR